MDGAAFTLDEFFSRNGLTRFLHDKLKKQGKGVREMRLGSKVMVTPEAEADWRRDREQPDAEDLKTIERLHKRGCKAGQASKAKRSASRQEATT